MTDELINHLGQISAIRVISRTSAMTYKNARKPLVEIVRELNVDAVVEGSVLHSGERLRIAAIRRLTVSEDLEEILLAKLERHQ
jgi:TolB-like protein